MRSLFFIKALSHFNINIVINAMDQQITKEEKFNFKVKALFFLLLLFVIISYFYVFSNNSAKQYRVDASNIEFFQINYSNFQDSISLRGTLVPRETMFLDAFEGGRVSKIYVEEGQLVRAGEKLVQLENNRLQLEVITRESQITEQLNNLQNSKFALAQDQLSLENNLIDIRFEILKLERDIERRKNLVKAKLASTESLELSEDTLSYFKAKLELALKRKIQTDSLREIQFAQIENSTARLSKNLDLSERNLDDLLVKAPIDGFLGSLNIELGQSVSKGTRIGKIDSSDDFKIISHVDEYYLENIKIGQLAVLSHSDDKYDLNISKISPEVQDNQFEVEFTFSAKVPPNLHRGQSFLIELITEEQRKAIVIPKRNYPVDENGTWVYLLDGDETIANKHYVTLKDTKKNLVEVLDGLSINDRIIVSDYSNFKSHSMLKLK